MVKILITVLVSWNRSRKKNYRLISYRIFRNLLNHSKRILLLLYKEQSAVVSLGSTPIWTNPNWTTEHWTSNCERQKNSNDRIFSVSSTSHTMPKEQSPWWTHFQAVNGMYWDVWILDINLCSGDFRVVQCLHCAKIIRRGKEGCLAKACSNSGMAAHMRSRHADQAAEVSDLFQNRP